MSTPRREPKGIPTGGRFATCPKCEQTIELTMSEPAPPTEPDERDYEWAADDCLVQSGIGNLTVDAYNSYERHIGFKGSTKISEIESECLPADVATKLQSVISMQGVGREIKFHPYDDDQWATPPQLWSTSLDDDERKAALAALDAAGLAVDEAALRYWEAGVPSGLAVWTSHYQPARLWEQIGKTVAAASPTARQRLELAEALAASVQREWVDQCDYLGSDDWVSDRAGDAES